MTAKTCHLHTSFVWLMLSTSLVWAASCKGSTGSGSRGSAQGQPPSQAAREPILETPIVATPTEKKGKSDSAQAMGQVFRKLKESAEALAKNQTELSLKLLLATPPDQKGNRILSPWGLSRALHLVMLGARGDTEAEMARSLFARLPAQEQHAAIHLVNLQVRRAGNNPSATMGLAHRAWVADRFPLSDAFVAQLKKVHGEALGRLGFRGNSSKAMAEINAWVSERTQGKIPSVLTGLSSDTSLLLVSASNFNARWASPFPKGDTRQEPFRTFDGELTVPLMRQTSAFPFVEAEGVRMVSLPCQGKQLSFLLLLPAPGKDAFDAFSKRLDVALLDRLKASMQPKVVRVVMPRFNLRDRRELKSSLGSLGMRRAFTPQADFSGITTSKEPLWIQEIIHEAFVEVNEEGTDTVAGAGTGAGTGAGKAPEPREIRADRPFLFLILHQRTGLVLFMGQVANPTSAK